MRGRHEGISIALGFEQQGKPPIHYGFRIKVDPSKGYVVDRELLRGEGISSFERVEENFQSDITSLHPVLDATSLGLPLLAGSDETWKAVLEALRRISVHQLSPQAIRSEPKIGPERRLSRDGQNAGDILSQLKPADRKWIETWLAVAVAGIKGVHVDMVAGRRVIGFAQQGHDGRTNLFDASMMSDGTLRSLAILLALRQSPRPSLVLLDEIEDSLHPMAHGALLDAVEAASKRVIRRRLHAQSGDSQPSDSPRGADSRHPVV